MSLVQDVGALHIKLRTVVVSTAAFMPFWYLSFYLLDVDILKSEIKNIGYVASICLAIVYQIASLIISIPYLQLLKREKDKDYRAMAGVSGMSILYFSALLYYAYSRHVTLMNFTQWVFICALIRLLISMAIMSIDDWASKKLKNDQDPDQVSSKESQPE